MRRIRRELKSGGEIAGIEFGDPIKPYAAVWLHATGFNAMTYQSLLAPLGLRARVAALDMRGHGRSTLPAKPRSLASWNRFRDDVIEWLDKEAPQGVVLGGHSMGGCVALLVAGKRPDLVKGLVLVDPVILPRKVYFWNHVFPPVSMLIARNNMAKQARKRKPVFKSFRDALDSYTGRGAFSSWREPFLADYLLDGIDRVDQQSPDSPEQTWRLLCEPKFEAATFAAQTQPAMACHAQGEEKADSHRHPTSEFAFGHQRQGARQTDPDASQPDDEADPRHVAFPAHGGAVRGARPVLGLHRASGRRLHRRGRRAGRALIVCAPPAGQLGNSL